MNDIISVKKEQPMLRHGHIFSPKSRIYFAWEKGQVNTGHLNQCEAGKFFPATERGLRDPLAPTDSGNSLPPRDGEILTANQGSARFLDAPGTHWDKHDVESGQILPVRWYYTAQHATRRWNYFITRNDWNPNLPLSRAQFEDKPFYQVQLHEQPFWSNGSALTPPNPTVHNLMLPQRSGYHVMLAVWEVANTGNAFYQVIDLNFTGASNTPVPVPTPIAPAALRSTAVTTNSVSLAWNAPSVTAASYRLYRDGALIGSQAATTYVDNGLAENTRYSYQVSSVNASGVESALSDALEVATLSAAQVNAVPSAPTSLHSMGVTASSISLMWGASQTGADVQSYIIYREGDEITRVAMSQLSYNDSGLQASTQYRYFVAAMDAQGRLSVPSNVLTISTAAAPAPEPTPEPAPEPTPAPEARRAWALGETFVTAEVVTHNNLLWSCIQGHTAWVANWAPGTPDSATLWRRA